MAVLDEGRSISYANRGMRVLLGMDKGNPDPVGYLLNPTYDDLMAVVPSGESIFAGVLTAGNGTDVFRSVVARAYRRGGQVLLIGEYDVSELDGQNRRMLALNREITNLQRDLIKEKRLLELTLKELRDTQAMLVHSEKMSALGKLTAGIAHEINNPVGFVLANLYNLETAFRDLREAYGELTALAEQSGPPEEVAAIAESHDLDFLFRDFDGLSAATREGVLRVKKIVDQLRNFSRLDEADWKPANIAESLRSTLAFVDAELRHHDIEVAVDLGEIPAVNCYPAELNQAFMNIIMNALQAMEGGGRLEIRAWEEDENVCVEFSDTGPGIAEEHLNRIFDPFYTTKPVGSGTGLGLTIAHKIVVEMHHGSLTVRSGQKGGAAFRMMIPRS